MMKYITKKKSFSYILAFVCLIINAEISANTTAVQLANINPATGGSITEPGNYYLGWDIPGNITIAADKVTLNLNGHTVRDISISGYIDVIITNGIVNGSSLTEGSAISIENSNNVHLSNLRIFGSESRSNLVRGINACNTYGLSLSNLLVEGFSSTGCKLTKSFSFVISDCQFNQNGSADNTVTMDRDRVGLYIDTTSDVVAAMVKGCTANGNRNDGFRVNGNGSNLPSVYFFDCIACNNGVGLLFDGASNGFHGSSCIFAAIRCIAENNKQHGFYTQKNTKFFFEGCFALNNMVDGFHNQGDDDSPGQVKECTAKCNVRCGFNNDGPGGNSQPVAYVANFANANKKHNYCRNDNNENGFPYCVRDADSDEAQFWRNVEC